MAAILRSRLNSTDEEVRRDAVSRLERGEESLALLIEALGDPSWRVRKEAVARIAAWQPPDRAARALTETLSEPENIGRRNAAIEGLARLGAVSLPYLTSAFDRYPGNRKLITDALGAIGDSRAVLTLSRALDDSDENIRVAAAEALGRIGGPAALAQLERALARGELLLSLGCLDALTRHGAVVSVASLVPLLASPALRPSVIEALGASQDPAALPHLVTALGAATRGVRDAAIAALARLHESRVDKTRRATEEALVALATGAEKALFDGLSGTPAARRAALKLLGLTRRPSVVLPLAQVLGEPEAGELAAEALVALGEITLNAMVEVAPLLDPPLRAKLFCLIPRLVTPGTPLGPLPRLRNLLGTALDDMDSEVAGAAGQALKAFGGPIVPRPRAVRPELRMSDGEFELIREIINQHCGLMFEPDSKFLVEKRLAARVEALGLSGFADYYRYLRRSAEDEFNEVVERLTTNETYFFRERYQLDAFQYEILPLLHTTRPRGRRLRVWSAGCATGEEAYTIAMLTLETGLFDGWDVRVVANDISRRVLNLARRGRYGRAAFRQTESELVRRYFQLVEGRHEVRPDVRQLVEFFIGNLLDEKTLAATGEVDAIFCRNVLMYFDLESRRQVVETFYRKLAKGGYLLLGHTESLINLSTSFELVHLKHDMVYRKP